MSGKLAEQHLQCSALLLAPETEGGWIRERRPSASSNAKKGLLLVPQQQLYLIGAHCSFQIKTSLFIIINRREWENIP